MNGCCAGPSQCSRKGRPAAGPHARTDGAVARHVRRGTLHLRSQRRGQVLEPVLLVGSGVPGDRNRRVALLQEDRPERVPLHALEDRIPHDGSVLHEGDLHGLHVDAHPGQHLLIAALALLTDPGGPGARHEPALHGIEHVGHAVPRHLLRPVKKCVILRGDEADSDVAPAVPIRLHIQEPLSRRDDNALQQDVEVAPIVVATVHDKGRRAGGYASAYVHLAWVDNTLRDEKILAVRHRLLQGHAQELRDKRCHRNGLVVSRGRLGERGVRKGLGAKVHRELKAELEAYRRAVERVLLDRAGRPKRLTVVEELDPVRRKVPQTPNHVPRLPELLILDHGADATVIEAVHDSSDAGGLDIFPPCTNPSDARDALRDAYRDLEVVPALREHHSAGDDGADVLRKRAASNQVRVEDGAGATRDDRLPHGVQA
eukprot:scaffold5011_cov255-Pinguiococcus_pyrenoidosus.AAC.6